MRIFRISGLACILAVGFLVLAGTAMADTTSAVEDLTPVASQTTVAVEQNAAPTEATPVSTELDFDKILNNWPGECPTGVPGCYQDSQCDAYCGGTGFGWCTSTLCCGCAG